MAEPEETPPPLAVEVMERADGADVDVSWVPPPLSPDQLLEASFVIYGYSEGTFHPLKTVDGVTTSAQVEGGYENYGVSVVVNGNESIIVKACVQVDDEFPFVHVTCTG